MNELAIFIYGLVVFAIVSTACWLIIWGIVQERHDREHLDAGLGSATDREPDGPSGGSE